MSSFTNIYRDAMDMMVSSCGFGINCKVYYAPTRYDKCDVCTSTIGNQSSNRYLTGAPVPFQDTGKCPSCGGSGRKPVESKEDITLLVIWNYKDWINVNLEVLKSPEGFVQTISKMSDLPKIKRANYIIMGSDNDIDGNVHHKFTRHGEPTPCGLGSALHILTMWKRTG